MNDVTDEPDAGSNQELGAELARRVAGDQRLRIEAQKTGVWSAELRGVDEDNARWIAEVIDAHGWPGAILVGTVGSQNAWLLVQHAPPELRERCLPLLKAAVDAGDAEMRNWAYLLDRVLVHRGEPQVYGTQYQQQGNEFAPSPIRDPDRVDDCEPSSAFRPSLSRRG